MSKINQMAVEMNETDLQQIEQERQHFSEDKQIARQVSDDQYREGVRPTHTRELLDNAVEQERADAKDDKPNMAIDPEDSDWTLMLFPTDKKAGSRFPDVKVVQPREHGKGFKEIGVGWKKDGARGEYFVLKIKTMG